MIIQVLSSPKKAAGQRAERGMLERPEGKLLGGGGSKGTGFLRQERQGRKGLWGEAG